MIVLGQMFTWI